MFNVKSSTTGKEELLSLSELKFKYGTYIVDDLFNEPFTNHILHVDGDTVHISKER